MKAISSESVKRIIQKWRSEKSKWLRANYPDIGHEVIDQAVAETESINKLYLHYDGALRRTGKELKRQLTGRLKINMILVIWKAKMTDPEYAKSYKPHKPEFEAKTPREREFLEFCINNCWSPDHKNNSKAVNRVLKNFKRIDADISGTDYTADAEAIVSNTIKTVLGNVNKIKISVYAYFWAVMRNQIYKYVEELKKDSEVIDYCSPFSYRITQEDAVPDEEREDRQAVEAFNRYDPTYKSVEQISDFYWKREKSGGGNLNDVDMIDYKATNERISNEDQDLKFDIEHQFNDPYQNELNSDIINDAVSQLPGIQRKIVRLYFFEEKTQTKIAKELGVSQQVVSYQLDQALDKLAKTIDEEDVGYKPRWRKILYPWE